MASLSPIVLERRCLPKVWGGRALESVLGIGLPAGEAIGETWELYDRPDGSSAVRDSATTLRSLMEEDAEALLGSGVESTPDGFFPLLLKYIDASEALSVQVHPDDVMARGERDWGKNEAWVVLEVGPNGRVIRGLAPGSNADAFSAVAHTAEVEEHLHGFRPEVGDVVSLPPGTVHALGPDVVVFEVQQNSDVTYRLYDWGRPREVHVEKALAAFREDANRTPAGERPVVIPELIDDSSCWLIRNEYFQVRRIDVNPGTTLATGGTFKVINVLSGNLTIGWHSGGEDPPVMVRRGDTVLIPGCVSDVFLSPVGTTRILVTGPGGPPS